MVRSQKLTVSLFISCAMVLLIGCTSSMVDDGSGSVGMLKHIETDKARYAPGQSVVFTVTASDLESNSILKINYFAEGDLIEADTLAIQQVSTKWTWTAPDEDYKGYLVEVSIQNGAPGNSALTIGVDVSSDWSVYPRYGFVSKYGDLTDARIDSVIHRLNRFHINGIQFYDWHNSHHTPLPTPDDTPPDTWVDIANRNIYKSTVERYISAAHNFNMNAMAYNLLYGAWGSGFDEDLSKTWILYKDKDHTDPFFLDLPEGWADDIYMMNTADSSWNNYVIASMAKTFEHLDFDGWHVDQIGDLGELYGYNAEQVVLKETFTPFLLKSKQMLNTKLVMNAVAQYGSAEISASPVDFLYNEVWNPDSTFNDLVRIIDEARGFSGQNIIIPAYMNYNNSSEKGTFNTPGILLTDAVIMAHGGMHLELGEHMLCHEYFPNDNLKMLPELESALLSYYDFAVAYERLLRSPNLIESDKHPESTEVSMANTATKGSIWTLGKVLGKKTIFHFINLKDTDNINWRDEDGLRPTPVELLNIPIAIADMHNVKSVKVVSPDYDGGAPQTLDFRYENEELNFDIPGLTYWTSIIVQQ